MLNSLYNDEFLWYNMDPNLVVGTISNPIKGLILALLTHQKV